MSKLKKVLANVGVFVLIAALVYVAGRALLGAWPMWSAMVNGGMMGGSGLLGALLMLLFWGGLVALVVWLLFSLFSGGRSKDEAGASRNTHDAAEETLRERFARGEIDAEEYEDALQVLRSQGVGSARDDARASKASLSMTGQEGDRPTPGDEPPSDNGGRTRRGV
jgi:putative membrane protein